MAMTFEATAEHLDPEDAAGAQFGPSPHLILGGGRRCQFHSYSSHLSSKEEEERLCSSFFLVFWPPSRKCSTETPR